jgi:hypothetical protein
MESKNRYAVVKAIELPNGVKAAAGATVELSREQAKYLLHGGKIVDASAQKPVKVEKPAKVEAAKGEK